MKVIYDGHVYREILKLDKENLSRVINLVDLFKEWGFNLTKLHLKKLNRVLWELRSGKCRLLFGMKADEAVILVVFLKKIPQTPTQYIKLAIKRFKNYI